MLSRDKTKQKTQKIPKQNKPTKTTKPKQKTTTKQKTQPNKNIKNSQTVLFKSCATNNF